MQILFRASHHHRDHLKFVLLPTDTQTHSLTRGERGRARALECKFTARVSEITPLSLPCTSKDRSRLGFPKLYDLKIVVFCRNL